MHLPYVAQLLAQTRLAQNSADCGNTGQQQQALIPRELLVQTEMTYAALNPYFPKVSPDGAWLSYTAPPPGGGLPAVWVQKVSDVLLGYKQPVDVSKQPEVFFVNYGWTYRRNTLYYINDNALYTIDITNPNSPITKEVMKTDKFGPEVLKVSPDRPSVLLVGVGETPAPPPDMMHMWAASLYELDVSSGTVKQVFSNNGTISSMVFDNQFNLRTALIRDSLELAHLRYCRNDGTTLAPAWVKLVDISQSSLIELDISSVQMPMKVLAVDASNNKMALWYDMMNTSLPVYVWKDLTRSYWQQEGNVIYRAEKAETFEWFNDYGQLIGISEMYGRPTMTIVDNRYVSDWQNVQAIDQNAAFAVESQSLDMSKWVLSSMPSDKMARYYLYDKNSAKAVLLFSMVPELDKYNMPTVQPVDVPSRDGFVQDCFLTKPYYAKAGEKRPLVLLSHGWPGSWPWQYNGWASLIADRGYYALACNNRGSSGHGRDYFAAGAGQYVNGTVALDNVDAANWAVATGLTDASTMCIFGASGGAIAEFYPLVNEPDLFQCAVDLYGSADPKSILVDAEHMKNLSDVSIKWYIKQFGFDWRTPEGKKFMADNAPINKAYKLKAALYMAHGVFDTYVPFSASVELLNRLKQYGNDKRVTFIAFPSEGHAGFQLPTEYVFFGYLELFLAKYLGGRYEPMGYIPGADYEVRYDTNGLTKMI